MTAALVRVALTGGIATGKSYCLSRFAELGLPVIDADQIARELVKPGSPALEAIVTRFGKAVLRPDGELDRRALAHIVFTDSGARADLDGILHPLVYAAIDEWFESLTGLYAASGAWRPTSPVAIADIPLLYETGHASDFDRVIVVACPREQQTQRMLQRGYTLADATARLAAQLPIDEKVRRADHVIDTSGTMEETERQLVQVYEELMSSR